MRCLDIYPSDLSLEDFRKINSKLLTSDFKPFPLVCWDIFSMQQQIDSSPNLVSREMTQLALMAERYDWNIDLENVMSNPYETLILTDINQTIVWANEDFKNMTGYDWQFAIGKKPNFLQGKSTNEVTRARIRNNVKERNTFKEIVVNYKKDKSLYHCQLQVFPIKNNNGIYTHFLALENAV